uniref:Glutamyl-tRNA(Gln) amidotransferase subunit C, mitochondrial n=1 Tax=Coturnix japonica TaxID=93934 RepID=A0A8C2TMX1_COTJA
PAARDVGAGVMAGTAGRDGESTQDQRDGVTMEVLDHLERLALVDFRDADGVERLRDAVRFAERLREVDTEGVQPMDSVLEDRCLYLREDDVTEGNCTAQLLKNATEKVEEYFVAPPGTIMWAKNIPQSPFSISVGKNSS